MNKRYQNRASNFGKRHILLKYKSIGSNDRGKLKNNRARESSLSEKLLSLNFRKSYFV